MSNTVLSTSGKPSRVISSTARRFVPPQDDFSPGLGCASTHVPVSELQYRAIPDVVPRVMSCRESCRAASHVEVAVVVESCHRDSVRFGRAKRNSRG